MTRPPIDYVTLCGGSKGAPVRTANENPSVSGPTSRRLWRGDLVPSQSQRGWRKSGSQGDSQDVQTLTRPFLRSPQTLVWTPPSTPVSTTGSTSRTPVHDPCSTPRLPLPQVESPPTPHSPSRPNLVRPRTHLTGPSELAPRPGRATGPDPQRVRDVTRKASGALPSGDGRTDGTARGEVVCVGQGSVRPDDERPKGRERGRQDINVVFINLLTFAFNVSSGRNVS